jgi:hypothetical protein
MAEGHPFVIVGGAVYVQLVLPGIVVPTFRVQRCRRPAMGRRIAPVVVQLVLPFGVVAARPERGSGVKVVLTVIRRLLVRVLVLLGSMPLST